MSIHRSFSVGLLGLLVAGLGVAGCSDAAEEAGESEARVSKLDVFWADAKKLKLDDLGRIAMMLGTEKLNDNLRLGVLRAKLEPPTVFGLKREPNALVPDGAEIKSLPEVTGLIASKFGDKELGAEVNKARQTYLEQGGGASRDRYFIESGFSVTANTGIGKSWSFDVPGLPNGAEVSIGFAVNAQLASRVVTAANDDKLPQLIKAPIEALSEMRGFVYPRSREAIQKMKPGEMYAIRGQGHLVGNFGLGMPLLIANPLQGFTYQIVASFGVSTLIGGQIDLQVVRMNGDEIVVDVGVEDGKVPAWSVGIRDSFGIKGICDNDGAPCLRKVKMGPVEVDLQKIVEKAVEKKLNGFLQTKIEIAGSKVNRRVSLSRFRFHLDGGDPTEVEQALQNLLMFDLRMAQAMNNRDLGEDKPPVVFEFDALKEASTTRFNFGFQLLGMNMYTAQNITREGSFVVQTPDGVQSLLYKNKVRLREPFQMSNGMTTTSVASQTIDKHGRGALEANLYVDLLAKDEHMDDDFMIDNADAVITAIAGPKAVETLDTYGNALERLVWSKCPVERDRDTSAKGGQTTQKWDEQCNVDLLAKPSIDGWAEPDARFNGQSMAQVKAAGLAAFDAETGDLPDDFRTLVHTAAEVRLTLQSVGIHGFDSTNGPLAAFTTDVRFDDKALDMLTKMGAQSTDGYKAALTEYLVAVNAPRVEVGAEKDKASVRKRVLKDYGKDIDRLAKTFQKGCKGYRLVVDAEARLPIDLPQNRYPHIEHPYGVRFEVDDKRLKEDSAEIRTIAHDRVYGLHRMIEDLRDGAGEVTKSTFGRIFSNGSNTDLDKGHAATLPLLRMLPAANLQVAVNVKADSKSTFWGKRERYQAAGFKSLPAAVVAKGSEVKTIDVKLFDLASIVNGE